MDWDPEVNQMVLQRLMGEKKKWNKEHPFGFFARPIIRYDGTKDYFKWKCKIPGPQGSPWAHSNYDLIMKMPKNYPLLPPICRFEPIIPHPHVSKDGTVNMPILCDDGTEKGWKPTITVKDVLLAIQKFLKDPPDLQTAPKQHMQFSFFKNYPEKCKNNVNGFVAKYNKQKGKTKMKKK